eukprot:EG_transcript_20293
MKGCRTVVLLDVDNWGFDELSKEPKSASRLPEDCFFWCFYGSGFEMHHGIDLEVVDFSEYAQKQGLVFETLLCDLQNRRRIWFSPAGGHSQAADMAILQTVALLRNMHVIVISSDKELGDSALKQKRSLPLDGKPRKVGVVRPTGRPFPPVWTEVLDMYSAHTGGTLW